MTPVFADTSFLLALTNRRDTYHSAARALAAKLQSPMVTTSWVLVELANALSKTSLRLQFSSSLERLKSHPRVEIVPADNDWFERGVQLYAARPDKEWSLTDCISFQVMTEKGLTDALTADHHFLQAGFNALLLP